MEIHILRRVGDEITHVKQDGEVSTTTIDKIREEFSEFVATVLTRDRMTYVEATVIKTSKGVHSMSLTARK